MESERPQPPLAAAPPRGGQGNSGRPIVSSSSRRVVVGPFNRVEGDLEVALDIENDVVRAARVTAPLYRGFENLLCERPLLDALVIVPRICGICSVSQSAAAVAAIADFAGAGTVMPANGRLASNLILASEVLLDHLTHFYLFFMPDFARDDYAARDWYPAVSARFRAKTGSAVADFLPARARFLTVLGLLAGKWPHTLALRPGGSTRAWRAGEKQRLQALLREFRVFLERRFFGDTLAAVLALADADALSAWVAAHRHAGDWPAFLALAESLDLATLARGTAPLLSAGAYPAADGNGFLFKSGVCGKNLPADFDPALIREHLGHSWFTDAAPQAPAAGETRPDADKADADRATGPGRRPPAGGETGHPGLDPGSIAGRMDSGVRRNDGNAARAESYTWCKAPRYAGAPAEVGAYARQVIDGQPLLTALAAAEGANTRSRVLARGVEVARLLLAMETWLAAIDDAAPFHVDTPLPASGAGVGLIEAARGTLGHWLCVDGGKIRRYQIVAPTTWNFSPRDDAGVPGPLEAALVGLPAPGGRPGVAVQHAVRSFDPCLACTVH